MRFIIYTVEYRERLSGQTLDMLIRQLPPAIQWKALRYRRWQDTYGCVFGNHLLRIALKRGGLSDDLNRLLYSREGKPYFAEGPHFNISHSGNRVACLISNERRVGIDIEYMADDISFNDFQRQFTSDEWDMILGAGSPREKFYEFWTAKESVIKADGRGLGIPLLTLDVSKDQTILLEGTTWRVTRIPRFEGYACHVSVEVAAEDSMGFEICEVSTTDTLLYNG